MTSTDAHTLTGAYVLDALSEREVRDFRGHLARCRTCTAEVREFHETAARLALAAAVTPPASLHARVVAALPGVRQLPPLPAGTAGLVPLGGRRWRGRLPSLVAAACLASAAVLGSWVVHTRQAVDVERVRAARAEQGVQALAAVMADPRARFRNAGLSGGGTATLVVSARQRRAVVLFDALPALADQRVYQIWYSRDGAMRPAGLLGPGQRAGTVLLTGDPRSAGAVGITAEPREGSPAPTSAPLALLAL